MLKNLNDMQPALKSVRQIISSQKVKMGSVDIEQPLPWKDIQQIDPFLLIHHWKDEFPGGQDPASVGVGPHPHRGFAPVSFIYKGEIHHRDSLGNESIIGPGGTQWMFAGSGVVHSERPSAPIAKEGGPLELIQFWINVPGIYKMDEPTYYPLNAEDTPTLSNPDDTFHIALVSGELLDQKGPIPTFHPVITAQLYFEQGGQMEWSLPTSHNSLIYVLEGSLMVNGEEVRARQMAWLQDESATTVKCEALEKGKGILLSGQPINERLATYGPFVMNTQREIMQALEDARSGAMGALEEQF